jgi:hypothetical protein
VYVTLWGLLNLETSISVQLRTPPYTKSPGVHFVPEFRSDVPPVRLRNGSNAPGRVVMTVQTAPDRLWAVAEQARAAAMDAGFVVQGVRNIDKGDGFGLPAGRRSPSMAVLYSMTAAQWASFTNTPYTPRAYSWPGHEGMDPPQYERHERCGSLQEPAALRCHRQGTRFSRTTPAFPLARWPRTWSLRRSVS